MKKILSKKEIKLLMPDYIFNMLNDEEKASFENGIRQYKTLQPELVEMQKTLAKININKINEEIDTITSNIPTNVIAKLKDEQTKSTINLLNINSNKNKIKLLNIIIPTSIAAVIILCFFLILIFNNNKTTIINTPTSVEKLSIKDTNIIKKDLNNINEYISVTNQNNYKKSNNNKKYSNTNEPEIITSIIDIDVDDIYDIDDIYDTYIYNYNYNYNYINETLINELENISDEEFSILMENFSNED